MGYIFVGLEKLIQEIFLRRLFFGKYKFLLPIVRTLSMFPVNKYGPGL